MAGKQLRGVDAERMDALQVRVGVESQQYADEQWKVACADRDIYNFATPAARERMEARRQYARCGLLAPQRNVVRFDDLTCSNLHSTLPQADAIRKRRRVTQHPRLYRLHGELQLTDAAPLHGEPSLGVWHLRELHSVPAAASFRVPRCPVRAPFGTATSGPAFGPAEQGPTRVEVTSMQA